MTLPNLLRIFIGYDPREAVAFHVLSHSILRQATCPVSITPLVKAHLGGIYWRERGPTESTDFALTRFLVPYLCGFDGRAVFMDCDMLVRCDIGELWEEIGRQPDKAVICCQHDYTPKMGAKFMGQPQTSYPRKNWSSFMVFNNQRCMALTPEYVNKATGLELHRFQWTTDAALGALPIRFNWLVGEYEPNQKAKVLHYTRGGIWHGPEHGGPEADLWLRERESMVSVIEAVA